MIECEHLSRTAHPALHFIDDKYDPVLITDTADLLDEGLWRWNVAAFTLHNFEHDRGDLFRRGRGFEKPIFDPVDHIARDRFLVGWKLVGEMPEFIWKRHMDHVQ